ncbi:MAG: U32 family peptidase [Eubacterium sp.]|jgi:putative protease|nr:U32 family peptidase [Eubacterium sp.]
MRKSAELLSPAGDFESLKSAVLFGADAVYLGGQAFGMRASSKNFSDEELSAAVKFAHRHNRKVYLACNTIPSNEEVKLFPDFIKKSASRGIDAAIVTDPGILEMIKEYAPKGFEIHMSTQAGITNYKSAIAMYNLGAKRIVLARELSISEIKKIREEIPEDLELEAFVHGAMCVSFSGRCLLSEYLTGRDANRGECAQPCRWRYHLMEETRQGEYFPIFEESGTFILNSKDLCMIEHLGKLIEAGITSFKIEGRAKSAYYTAVITGAYRAALDASLKGKPAPEWAIVEVNTVSHREYSTGFYFGTPGQNYKNGGYIRDYDFVGTVDLCKNGKLHITQRNHFKKSDKIEIISPMERPEKLEILNMTDIDGKERETANIAGEKLILHCKKDFSAGSFLRKKLSL